MIMGLVIAASLMAVIVAMQSGFFPVMLETREPAGYYTEIVPETYTVKKGSPEESIYQKFSSFIEGMPKTGIEYRLYETSSGVSEVYDNYAESLQNDGYEACEEYTGSIAYEGQQIYFYTFVKGITLVVFGVMPKGTGVYVLYSTGSIADYQELVTWLKEKI